VIALEPLESLVMYKYMDKGRTAVLMDTKRIKPTRMDIERIKYPEMSTIAKTLKSTAKSVDMVDASEAAKKAAGATVYANIYLLGKAMKKKLLKLDKGKVMVILRMLPSPDVNENIFKLALK
jgi:Pyruvate/2-oxoacid:ferredoxin oxidoreductase gamma subunit